MKLPEATQYIVDQYLSGLLSKEELEKFIQRLSQEPDLKREVERQELLLDEAVKEGMEEYVSLQDRVKAIHEKVVVNEQEAPPRRIRPLRYWISAAAAILAFAFIAYFLMNKQLSSEELITEYIAPPEISLIEKGDSEQVLFQAQTAFNKQDFQAALPHFNAHLLTKPDDFQVILYRGMAHLQLGQFAEAEQDFQAVAKSPAIFKSEGNWYLALTYLKQEKIEQGRKELEALLEREDFSHKEEAKVLFEGI